MNPLEKIETLKWLLSDESTYTYYKSIISKNYFREEKAAYLRGEIDYGLGEDMKPLLDQMAKTDLQPDIEREMRFSELIKSPAKVLAKFKTKVDQDYGINIDIVEFWEKYYADLTGFEPGAMEKFKEENIIKQIIEYAEEEKNRFNRVASNLQKEPTSLQIIEDKTDSSLHLPFLHFFADKEKHDFTFKALRHFSFINPKGECILKGRFEGKIAAFIEALVRNGILPMNKDTYQHKLFCKILDLPPKRFKKESKQYDEIFEKVDKYCKENYKNR
ncbi:hypothetical protein ACO2Q8_05280 [Larkinella sp. VNQ87]|uniref:hypothetical protein n=1 Tax=Larkinella sp. VNQ87 TaxID=3400921 RepID=UPI003C0448C6